MKKLWVLTLGLILGVGTMTPVYATPIGCVGKNGNNCKVTITFGGRTFLEVVNVDANGIGHVNNVTESVNGLSLTINSLTLDPDPSILFSYSATNTSSIPAAFAVAFVDAIDLTGTINAASSIGYTLTSIAKAASLTALPDANPNVCGPGAQGTGGCVLTAYDVSATNAMINKGVDVGPSVIAGSAPCTAFNGFTSNCPSGNDPTFATTHTFTGGPFVAMEVFLNFSLSGNSSAGLSGAVTQDLVVPEPETLLLMGSGLLGFAGWRRYSSRA